MTLSGPHGSPNRGQSVPSHSGKPVTGGLRESRNHCISEGGGATSWLPVPVCGRPTGPMRPWGPALSKGILAPQEWQAAGPLLGGQNPRRAGGGSPSSVPAAAVVPPIQAGHRLTRSSPARTVCESSPDSPPPH